MNAKSFLSLGLVLSLFAACGSGPPYAATAIENPDETLAPVQLLDGSLVDAIQAGQPIVTRVPGTGQLEIRVRLRNVSSEDLAVHWRVEFRDEADTYAENPPRSELRIRRGDTETVHLLSKTSRADTFVLRIGELR